MERLVIAAVLGALAALVALRGSRRVGVDGPTLTAHQVPEQVQRSDFVEPDAPWLVIVFSSTTCDACAAVRSKVEALRSDVVAVHDVDAVADAALHEAYEIDAVPMTLLVDADGLVVRSFLGPVPATDLWSAVADARAADGSERGDEAGR